MISEKIVGEKGESRRERTYVFKSTFRNKYFKGLKSFNDLPLLLVVLADNRE